MRVLFAFFTFVTMAAAFSPAVVKKESTVKLAAAMNRRDLIAGIAGMVLAAPQMAQAATQAISNKSGASTNANTWFYDESKVFEAAQMPTGDKLDLNAAIVTEYQQFRGMYPHAAGMIASHGPYTSVQDIYKIQGVTADDKKLFKTYEKEFTVNPPGRAFDERVNQRQST